MAKALQRQRGRPPLDVIEEAVRLLRGTPLDVLLAYYVGAVPYWLAMLYFLADMSHGGRAHSYLAEASLGLGALYVWMKCWQAVFARGVWAVHAMEPPPRWTPRRVARLVRAQAALQPPGLFAWAFAVLALFPYAWVCGFCHGVSVFGDGESSDLRAVIRRAGAQAGLWPAQAHYGLLFLLTFAFFVWLNACAFTLFAPQLLKMFFGIETVFTQNPFGLLNSTVLAATLGVTYLCFDPIRKAFYVLRCFESIARDSGDDLRIQLRRLQSEASRLAGAALVAFFLSLAAAATARAEPAAAPPASSARVDAAQLDHSIERVLQRREYLWRLPREPLAEKGGLTLLIEDIFNTIGRWYRKVGDAVGDFFDWLRRAFQGDRSSRSPGEGEFSFASSAKWIIFAACAFAIIGFGVLLWRLYKQEKIRTVKAEAMTGAPDLAADDVAADQLPEDGWMQLARELIARGEMRLALRASFLAGLAHLGQRGLISIARYKSNLEYERELRRRARARGELTAAFDQNRAAFERSWYGPHAVTPEIIESFNRNLEKIRAC